MVDRKIGDIINTYIRELHSKGLEISKVFLYGSWSRGEQTDESDIDLVLISPNYNSMNSEKLNAAAWLSNFRIAHRIEPIILSESKFYSDDFSPLIELIKHEGVEIAA